MQNFPELISTVGSIAGLIAMAFTAITAYSAIVKANYGRQRDLNHLFESYRQSTEAIKILQDDVEGLELAIKDNTRALNDIKRDIEEIIMVLRIRGPRSEEIH